MHQIQTIFPACVVGYAKTKLTTKIKSEQEMFKIINLCIILRYLRTPQLLKSIRDLVVRLKKFTLKLSAQHGSSCT